MGKRKWNDLTGMRPELRIFHRVKIPVYPVVMSFDDLKYWPKNLRTILAFEVLATEAGHPLVQIDVDKIAAFLLQRPELKLWDLAKSIARNGVRAPLIVLEDGTLLDGNRRFFACAALRRSDPTKYQDVLASIPAWVIKNNDLDEQKRLNILAEANFVSDYKVEWPLEVKAQVVCDHFEKVLKRAGDREAAFTEAAEIYGVDRRTIREYLDSVALAKEYIASAPKGRTNEFREHVQSRFVYFWEFWNKATTGRSALDSEKELPKVKTLFFKMIETSRFKNMKQVEPMVRAIRDDHAWSLLEESLGSKIDQVEVIVNEGKAIKSSEDKIRNFFRWLDKSDTSKFTKSAKDLLRQLVDLCSRIIAARGDK
jgi:hypothetical protein